MQATMWLHCTIVLWTDQQKSSQAFDSTPVEEIDMKSPKLEAGKFNKT